MLKNLEANVEEMERMGGPDNPDGESARSRVEWAMSTVKDAADHYESTLVDMRQSLNAVSLCLSYLYGPIITIV